jgi:hypothetical protein
LCLTVQVQAQTQRGLKDNYNTEKFPEISFVWNTANPEVLERSQFTLTENDQNIDFQFANLPKNNIPQTQKSILFLWEDMVSHKGQTDFIRNLLIRFFSETTLTNNDRFNIAVFNRKKDTEKKMLQTLLLDFEVDSYKLNNVVKNYKNDNRHFNEFPLQSDLYLAINKGIDLLKKEPSDRIGFIVVITAGLNIKAAGASTEMETVRKNAMEAGIPIYVVKYPIFGDTPEINSLAESTYGLSTASIKAETALHELQGFYKNFNTRSYGQDYKITFTTIAKRDGKAHSIRLFIDKVPQQISSFNAPNMTFGLWIKENLWLFIGLVASFVVIVVLVIILLVHNKKKNAALIQANLENVRQEADAKTNAARQQAEKIRQEQIDFQQKQEREKHVAAVQAEHDHLVRLMQTKNLFPRLQCKVEGNTFTYSVNKPQTTLGRNADNDVVLNNQTVSGFHAEINFTGGAFEIVNKSKSYKQGIIINGQFFQQATLKSGDMIGLGEAIITFYV